MPEVLHDVFDRVAVTVERRRLLSCCGRRSEVAAIGVVDPGQVPQHLAHARQELLQGDGLESECGIQVVELEQLAVQLACVRRRAQLLQRVACADDRDLGASEPQELLPSGLPLRKVAVGLIGEVERRREARLDPVDAVEVGVDRVPALRLRRGAASGEEECGEEDEAERSAHARYFSRTTVETLPSPWWKTSLTRPFPATNQLVRVPLPNLKPGWLSEARTTSASNVPAGTLTFWIPSTFDEPLTPNVEKSRLGFFEPHTWPAAGYAVSDGLKPKFIRSNGVKKWRRLPAGSDFGPSGGNLIAVAAFVSPQMFVI